MTNSTRYFHPQIFFIHFITNFYLLQVSFMSCFAQIPIKSSKDSVLEKYNFSTLPQSSLLEFNKNILCIYQDGSNNFWFGTDGDGLYQYDMKKKLNHYTVADGLSSDQILSIQQDKLGNYWFSAGGYTVNKYDGKSFTKYPTNQNLQSVSFYEKNWSIEPNDLFFPAGGGLYRYRDLSGSSTNLSTFTYLPFQVEKNNLGNSTHSHHKLTAYGVYSLLQDSHNQLWIGTQNKGVCRYDKQSMTWYTELGLAGPAVLALFEDKNGCLWFGNNGRGLFYYNILDTSNKIINFTDEQGLSNPEFLKSGKSDSSNLARIYSINEDNDGNMWFGTVDSGVWRYDGHKLTNFTIKDGLPSNAVNTIYKDKSGDLWFGTNRGLSKFNGKFFMKVLF